MLNELKQDIRDEISAKFELNSNVEMFLYFLSETFHYLKLMFLDSYNNLKECIKSKDMIFIHHINFPLLRINKLIIIIKAYFNSGEKCIAICKKINSNNAVAAVCIKISNLINKLKLEEIEEAYIINQNNVIVASTSNSYTNVNVMDDHKHLPKGHADIFKNLNIK